MEMSLEPIPQKNEPIVQNRSHTQETEEEGKEKEKKEKIKKDLFQKRKEVKKIQQWLSMFKYSETWGEGGGRDGGTMVGKTENQDEWALEKHPLKELSIIFLRNLHSGSGTHVLCLQANKRATSLLEELAVFMEKY